MLQSVFKDLYDQEVLIFLNTDNYLTNNDEKIDLNIFINRDKFLENYKEPIKLGWIFTYNMDLNRVVKEIQDDTCCSIEFGFNSDTEKKALEVGRMLVESLKKFGFIAKWDEHALKNHIISTVVAYCDISEQVQDLINVSDLQ